MGLKKRFEHILNPLHVYCRLVEFGIPKGKARSFSLFYDKMVFRRRGKKKDKRGKHHKYVCELAEELSKKPYVSEVKKNLEYSLGEVDVWVLFRNGQQAYYEVKCRDSVKGRKKALDQLVRWTAHKHYFNKKGVYLGVYWTPKRQRVMAKNGYKR